MLRQIYTLINVFTIHIQSTSDAIEINRKRKTFSVPSLVLDFSVYLFFPSALPLLKINKDMIRLLLLNYLPSALADLWMGFGEALTSNMSTENTH